MDKIHPEMLKALDEFGLSWFTRLFNIMWESGTVPVDWLTGVVVPIFKVYICFVDLEKAYDQGCFRSMWFQVH